MEFKRVNDSEFPIRVVFEGQEIEVISAAFSEMMYRQALKGNIGSVSDFDIALANWTVNSKGRTAKLRSPDNVTSTLYEFHANTDDVIANMPEITRKPAFLDPTIPKRMELGKIALELADQITERSTQTTDDEKAVRDFIGQLERGIPPTPEN